MVMQIVNKWHKCLRLLSTFAYKGSTQSHVRQVCVTCVSSFHHHCCSLVLPVVNFLTIYFTDSKDIDYCQASFIVRVKTLNMPRLPRHSLQGTMSIFHQSFRSLLISLFQSQKLLYKIPHCFSNGWIRPPILPDWPLYEGSIAGLVWFHQTPGPVGLPGNLQTRFHFPQKKQLGRNNVKLNWFLLLL